MKYSAKSTPEVVYKLRRIFRALSFAGVWIQLSIRYGRTKRFREHSRYSRPACRNMTGTSWCCAQPWMVNDSFHCSYSKSGALAPTTESSSCHQAQGQTIATDVLRNRSKLNVIFVMRTLRVVWFFAGTPQDKADSALYSARIPEGHRYNVMEKCRIIQTVE